jgi:phage I-like protein
MTQPQTLLQAALNRLSARLGSGLADAAAELAVLAQDAPERLRQEWDLFREEVELEAERLERGEAAGADDLDLQATPVPARSGDPQEQIDSLRAQVARLTRRLEDQP